MVLNLVKGIMQGMALDVMQTCCSLLWEHTLRFWGTILVHAICEIIQLISYESLMW